MSTSLRVTSGRQDRGESLFLLQCGDQFSTICRTDSSVCIEAVQSSVLLKDKKSVVFAAWRPVLDLTIGQRVLFALRQSNIGVTERKKSPSFLQRGEQIPA